MILEDNFIPIIIENLTDHVLYMAAVTTDSSGKDKWLVVSETRDTSWLKFDYDSCNLEVLPGQNQPLKYIEHWGMTATMYLSVKPLQGRPDFHSALFIYDQIEINSQLVDPIATDPIWCLNWKIAYDNFFGLPMQVKLNLQEIGCKRTTCRSNVIHSLAQISTPFNRYKIPKNYDQVYRWFSPALHDPGNIWKEAIREGLLKLDGQEFKYTNQAGSTFCRFFNATENSIEVEETTTIDTQAVVRFFTLKNIDTISAIRGTLLIEDIIVSGEFTAPADEPAIQSGAYIAAAINRGVLYDTDLWDEGNVEVDYFLYKGNYYRFNAENCGQFNPYAKLIHDYSSYSKGIGFSYDEYFARGNNIKYPFTEDNQSILTIGILPF